jgi:NleD-like pathogen effector protein (putative zinc metallopeptidase)
MGHLHEDRRANSEGLARTAHRRQGPLGPAEATVLALQRSAGNRAVAGLLGARSQLARKKLTRRDEFLTDAGGISGILRPVANALARYNNRHGAATPLGRLELLWALEQAIYGFYRDRASAKLKGDDVDAVGKLLQEAEDEYADVIDAYGLHMLPVDTTGWPQADVAEATALWFSIAESRGRILVAGTTGYRKRTFANLAKIMRTPTGRRLLAYLNKGTAKQDIGKRVYISDELPPELATSGLDVNKKSYARGLRERAKFATDKAQDVKHTATKPRRIKASKYQAVQGPFGFANVAPTDLEEAIWTGKKGFTVTGQPGFFTFGKGATGAFVHTIRAWDIEQDIPNLQGHISYTPEFITLAHELGHAMHHLAGATTGGTTLDAVLRPAGSLDTDWSNAEEVFTIMGIDNPIRREAGLDYRAKHAGLPSGRKTKIKQRLMKAFQDRINPLYAGLQGTDRQALLNWMQISYGPATQGDRPAILQPETQQAFNDFLTGLEQTLVARQAEDSDSSSSSDDDSVTVSG